MPNYAPRVSMSYDDVSGVIQVWADSADKVAVFEHPADEDVNSTHVHLILIGCKYKTAEPLKRQFNAITQTTRKGNELWSWEHKDHPDPDIGFLKYMSKGSIAPKYLKNISEQEVEHWRQQWKPNTPKAPSLRQTSLDEDAKKKLTKYAIVLEVVKKVLEKHPTAVSEERKEAILADVPDDIIIKFIRNVLIKDNQVLGLYKVMDIYDAYVMYYQKEKFLANCLQVLQKRLPRV